MRIHRLVTAVLMGVLFLTSITHAIVIRHDRDDHHYRKLAELYPMVCRVGQAMGTLVDSLWVLTAAHVAEGASRTGSPVRIADRDVAVSDVFLHPSFALEDQHRDLALIRLSQPVTDVTPASLYRGSNELGQRVTFVGDGWHGTGLDGPSKGERIRRAAQNTVDSVYPGWLRFHFDAPPGGDSLEGISGPGDSGGPALVHRGDSILIIGVSAYNDGKPECRYGSNEYYSRVSDELEWIDGVMSGSIAADDSPQLMRYGQTADGRQTVERSESKSVTIPSEEDSRMYRVLAALEESVQGNSIETYLSLFNAEYLEKQQGDPDMVSMMHTFLVNAIRTRGPIIGYHPLPREGVVIPDSKYPMRPIVFHLKDGIPGYFGIALTPDGRIDHFSLFIMEGICDGGASCPAMRPRDDLPQSPD